MARTFQMLWPPVLAIVLAPVESDHTLLLLSELNFSGLDPPCFVHSTWISQRSCPEAVFLLPFNFDWIPYLVDPRIIKKRELTHLKKLWHHLKNVKPPQKSFNKCGFHISKSLEPLNIFGAISQICGATSKTFKKCWAILNFLEPLHKFMESPQKHSENTCAIFQKKPLNHIKNIEATSQNCETTSNFLEPRW